MATLTVYIFKMHRLICVIFGTPEGCFVANMAYLSTLFIVINLANLGMHSTSCQKNNAMMLVNQKET